MKKRGVVSTLGLLLVIGVIAPTAQAQEGVCLNAAFGVRTLTGIAEAYITGLVDAMHVAAASADVKSGDWDQMQDLLTQFEDSELPYDAWFLQPDGSYYKTMTGLASANLSDRAYFPRVMAGETTMEDLVVSRSTGRKSMVLTVPVFHGPTVIGALGVTLYLDDFSALLMDKLRLPGNVGFYGYRTEDGLICVHENPDLLLEPDADSGIELASGGVQISVVLGWTFVLGTTQ